MLPSCASIMSGTSQTIKVTSTPPGAACTLNRKETSEGEEVEIASVDPTPGEAHISKTKYPITVQCSKPGHFDATSHLESGNEGSTLGNILLGGGIGWAVDSARGADNKYAEFVNVILTKEE